ncbi:MAG TPA: citrate lyase subunit alpha [bacterium]|nr:citrate lyase subunit alpha [bacterium]HNT64249.1 citrate lyase subunit alpha [bacterium]
MNWIKNAVGRMVPAEIDGRALRPFRGAGADKGGGRQAGALIRAASDYKNKLLSSIDKAIDACEIRDGMTIGFHHHLRNGDLLINLVMEKLATRGLRDLVLAPSALFPVHEKLVDYIDRGVISHVEGSMNGPVGRACSLGKMKKTAVLRSHGGRFRAIQDGDLKIDVAFIAAPCADSHGNANGLNGPSACGPLGFALADSLWADRVVVVTDNLVPFPCYPWSIEGGHVDFVVQVDSLGDPAQIMSGTTRITRSPTRLLIAEYAAQFVRDSGIMTEPNFSFQAGAGGVSLAFVKYMSDMMAAKGVVADFVRGGSTKYMVEMLESGMTRYILDGQSFDLDGVRSLRENPNHIETNPFVSYNYHTKGCFAQRVQVSVLGATEVDLEFNVNVNTHSDGWLLHGIGGFTDAADANVTIITAPLVRNRVPIVVDSVTTVTAPGEMIDVLVTEYGIAINPRRHDLLERVKKSSLPICSIDELHHRAMQMTGIPQKPEFADRVVALIEFRDGSIIDAVRQRIVRS